MSNTREYIDFKLYLTKGPGGDDNYQVSLLPTPEVGESILPVPFSINEGAYQKNQRNLQSKEITIFNLAMIGNQFADWLLPQGAIRSLFKQALAKVGNHGGVRLRLIIADHNLKQIPWEFVRNPLMSEDNAFSFLALDPRISIVRHEPLEQPHREPIQPKASMTVLRMMIATASPADKNPLAIEEELKRLRAELDGHKAENVDIELITEQNARWDVVAKKLKKREAYPFHIFHFAGHGEMQTVESNVKLDDMELGSLIFVDEQNHSAPIPAIEFANQMHTAGIWMVTLGACESGERSTLSPWHGVAGALLKYNIPVVIAMQNEIIDSFATTFSQEFYGMLESGLSLDEAMNWSRRKMAPNLLEKYDPESQNIEWGLPVLYSRLPDGVLVPDFVEKQSDTAKKTRETIQTEIDAVINIEQAFDNISGEVTGGDADGKDIRGKEINVKQTAKNVEEGAKITGFKF